MSQYSSERSRSIAFRSSFDIPCQQFGLNYEQSWVPYDCAKSGKPILGGFEARQVSSAKVDFRQTI